MLFKSWLASLTKRRWLSPQKRRCRSFFRSVEPLEQRVYLSALFSQFIDPNPSPGNRFGDNVVPLSTGNVVVTSPFDDAGGPDAGAVYLFNGSTGELISTLHGSSASDNVGSGGVTALDNGNFIVLSTSWDNAGVSNVGAATWGDGNVGVTGSVSAANSLVGTTANDRVGSGGVTALGSGNYVVQSPSWINDAVSLAGAATWGDGSVGITGSVSAANSLVGSSRFDRVGNTVIALANGNYVVSSSGWDNGSVRNVGAVTWGDGASGVTGTISTANSLVGSVSSDSVGTNVTALSNGNYVVASNNWDNGSVRNVGAVTWGSGTAGITGVVSSANSLVGLTPSDLVGSGGVTALSSGNYVVSSPLWDDGAVGNVGAVTWGNGTTGVTGTVSSANSLVGSTADDRLGFDFGVLPVTELTNGNYVVQSPRWDNGLVVDAGAVTWGSGTTGIAGAVSANNSLVGSQDYDRVGDQGVTLLSNGNYVVGSWNWDNGPVSNAGAATWGNGSVGITGAVTAANSLVGSQASENVGGYITALTNGNYVVTTDSWDNGAAADAGAVTWGSGTTGVIGVVSATNSLVGSSIGDRIGKIEIRPGFFAPGGVTALSNGNYVVQSTSWDNGGAVNVGAATWGDGTTGVTGVVSSANSLIGSTSDDKVGYEVTALSNGNYLVSSSSWDKGAVSDVGAVTWGSGTTGVIGVVSTTNSLVGSTTGDRVGAAGITVLTNGNYVVATESWDNGAATNAGAVTWGNGTTGVAGVVSAANSLVGSHANDLVGLASVTALTNGNYVVRSPNWDNELVVDAGAVTFGNGATGVIGRITSLNSVMGMTPNTNLQDVVVDDANDEFFSRFVLDDGGRVWVGSQQDGFFPSISVPSGQIAYEDVDQPLSGISIGDGGTATVTLTLDVSYGTLTVRSNTVLDVTGNGTGTVTLMGTTANINATLASLVYRGDLNYSGGDTLRLAATDGFRSGSKASLAINIVSAADQAFALQARVRDLQTAGVLNKGQANSLIVKLNLKDNSGDIGKVEAFLKQVHVFHSSHRLTLEQSNALVDLGEILLLSVKRR